MSGIPAPVRRALQTRPVRISLMLAGGILASVPWVHWQSRPSRPLKVGILDKTVPEPSRREHAGLSWLLRHLKFVNPDGRPHDPLRDYYGFFPLSGGQWEAREPSFRSQQPDFIYLADTYGVYSEEFHGKALGNRSQQLYGGLRPEEILDLEAAFPTCLTLVGEFNSFANPTEGAARAACQGWFGLRWSGWTGRFFKDLDRRGEVPPWAPRTYQIQTGQEWAFEGPGILLVNEDDRIEVLQEGEDLIPGRGLRFQGRPEGLRRLNLPSEARFDYWFDLVEALPGTEVLADFELPLLPEGQRRLQGQGLPTRIPAVLAGWRASTRTYYFAGDFVDAWPAPNFHRISWISPFRRAVSREVAGDPQSFFWRAYIPMMTRILEDTWARKLKK